MAKKHFTTTDFEGFAALDNKNQCYYFKNALNILPFYHLYTLLWTCDSNVEISLRKSRFKVNTILSLSLTCVLQVYTVSKQRFFFVIYSVAGCYLFIQTYIKGSASFFVEKADKFPQNFKVFKVLFLLNH